MVRPTVPPNTPTPPLRTLDFAIAPSHGLERLEQADLIALPAVSDARVRLAGDPSSARRFPEDLLEALHRAIHRGARVLSVCSGAFILGDAGLLDDRRCTTHWRHHFRIWPGVTPTPTAVCSAATPRPSPVSFSHSPPKSSNIGSMRFVLRVLVSAAALGVATWAVSGIELLAGSGWTRVGTLLAVALIFGLINATLKPLIKVIGCAFYVLTLGLAALVVNGLLLWLTSVVAGDLTLPFHVTGFWPAFWGAIVVGLVSWLLNLLIGDNRRRKDGKDEPPPVRVVRVR
jgi:putative membrane protein